MPINIACPRCHKDYTLADDTLGKTVRCKECGDTFPVTDGAGNFVATDDLPPVARRYRDDEYEDRPRPRRRRPVATGSGNSLLIGLILGGVVLLVLLPIGGIILVTVLVSRAPRPAANLNNFPGMPPAGADWNQLRLGMTEQEVTNLFGPPASSHDYEGIHVIHANVTEDEVRGPDGRTRPVRRLHYFKGVGQMGFVDITLVDGRVYKFKK